MRTTGLVIFDALDEIMLDLLYDIRNNNVPTCAAMQRFLRDAGPPTLVAAGANDEIFPEEVVRQILRDQPRRVPRS